METMWSYTKNVANYMLVPVRVGMDKGHEALINLTTTNSPENINDDSKKSEKVERIGQSNFVYDHVVAILPPTEVYPNLFLGSSYNAALLSGLRSRNIKYVINVSNEISNYYPDNITYYNITIKDDGKDKIQDHLETSYEIIESFLNNNDGNVLVHCYMGASRSASIITYYISKKTGRTIDDVLNELKAKRSNINPSCLLYNELKETETHVYSKV